jgi:adenylate cyclase class IV
MPFEIELKAHVRDTETLRNQLSEKANFLFAFTKEDT